MIIVIINKSKGSYQRFKRSLITLPSILLLTAKSLKLQKDSDTNSHDFIIFPQTQSGRITSGLD